MGSVLQRPGGSNLALGGGTLDVRLSNSATGNSQRFNVTTFSTGSGAIRVT